MTRAISGLNGGPAGYRTDMPGGVKSAKRWTQRTGYVQRLKSGSLRVRVYAGADALTGRPLYLSEVVAAGPDVEERAEETRLRLLALVAERKNPKTNATLSQLLQAHLDFVNPDPRCKHSLACYIAKHIDDRIGKRSAGSISTDDIEWFYVELRRCRDH